MKISLIPVADWRLIHLNVVWLTAAMLFAGLILLLTQGLLQYNRSQLQPLQVRLNEARAAAGAAQTALQDAQENNQRYLELVGRGVIGGTEHRLEWVEKLTTLKRADAQLNLRYEIKPQRVLEMSVPAGSSALYASRMSLKYAALHEETFSRLHQSLRDVPGWPVTQRCVLGRNKESALRLEVECEYDWLSIAPVAVKPEGEAPQ